MNNYFNYIKSNRGINLSKNKIIASKDQIDQLNLSAYTISKAANFYLKNLGDKQIDYVYINKAKLNILPVLYKIANFPHLTGIDFAFSTAAEKFEFLKNGNNNKPLIIEKNGKTKQKIDTLNMLPELINSDSSVLSDLNKIRQAKRIGFSRVIKDPQDKLLLALQNFEPSIYSPRSLLNMEKTSEYDNVPENTILGIFEESKTKFEGKEVGIGAKLIDLNSKYVKTPQEGMQLSALVSKNLLQRQIEKQNKQKKAAQRAAFLRCRGMERE